MNVTPPGLFTPLYLKTSPDTPWPEDQPVFHLLTADGLFLCRNHPFFRSSVPVSGGPSELAPHEAFASLAFPRIPQRLFELTVGFFDLVGNRHGAEAIVLLAWDGRRRRVELLVPTQSAVVGTDGAGVPYPLTVRYDPPETPPDLLVFGDIHSHVHGPAYASGMDVADEADRPGLHLVVGRLHLDPPDLHLAVTLDGARFSVADPFSVIDGYQARRSAEVPAAWLERHSVSHWSCPTSPLPAPLP